jgi:integrase
LLSIANTRYKMRVLVRVATLTKRRKHIKMTDSRAKTLTEPGLHRDRGDGAQACLYVQVTPSAIDGAKASDVARSWIFRFKSPIHKRARQMGLGSVLDISLHEARELARIQRKLIKFERKDPIDERKRALAAAQIEAAKLVTFAQVVEQYLADRPDGQNAKHQAQVQASLTVETRAINHLPIRDVDTQLILSVLKPTWKTRTVTMQRVRARIERVLDYATVHHYRTGDNPARWRGHLEHVLSKTENKADNHHKAMPVEQLPAFMAKLRENDSRTARALEFVILTAARTDEGLGARWSEIDVATRTWTVPAERMKGRREHCVPLSSRALEILAALPRDGGPFVFSGAHPGKPLSGNAMYLFLRDKMVDATTHGFRSSFKSWADSRGFPDDVSELALAHKDRNTVRAAYKRSDRFEERKPLMESWARFCGDPAGKVIAIRSARA